MWRLKVAKGMVLVEAIFGLFIIGVLVILGSSLLLASSNQMAKSDCYFQNQVDRLMDLRQGQAVDLVLGSKPADSGDFPLTPTQACPIQWEEEIQLEAIHYQSFRLPSP